MRRLVEKWWRKLWNRRWKSCGIGGGKVGVLNVDANERWESRSFPIVLPEICTRISTWGLGKKSDWGIRFYTFPRSLLLL